MKKTTTLILGIIFAVVMVLVASYTERMAPVHALATLIFQLCLCVAIGTWCVSAVWYKRKHRAR